MSTDKKIEKVIVYGVISYRPIKRYVLDMVDLPEELDSQMVYSILMKAKEDFKLAGTGFIMLVRGEVYMLSRVTTKKYEIFKLEENKEDD